ncbi:unnamed protein product, partial [Aphanomyces euteiches]
MAFTCLFNDCPNPALPTGKCERHKNRAKCMVDGCRNQTYSRNACVKHGGRNKCRFQGCSLNVRSQGFCSKHGACIVKKSCQVNGCTKSAHARRRCVRDGGRQRHKTNVSSKQRKRTTKYQSTILDLSCLDIDNDTLNNILGDIAAMEAKTSDNSSLEFSKEGH